MNQKRIEEFFPYALLAVLCTLLYLKTLFFGLTFFDDDVLLSVPQHRNPSIPDFLKIFMTVDISNAHYRPMNMLSFFWDSLGGKFSLYMPRITNLVLHILNSCLVFILFKKFSFKKETALSFAVIFAVHPALVQAVAWITGRIDSLLCVFVLLAMINFLSFLDTNHRKYFLGHLAFELLALLTKETAIVLPVLCVAYVFLIRRNNEAMQTIRKMILPWAAVILIWLALRQSALNGGLGLPSGIAESFFTNLPALILYFGKVILPINLSVLPILENSNLWIGALAILFILILLKFSNRRRIGVVLFGLSWFVLFLIPSFVRGFVFPEYRLYVPMIGIFFLLHETKFTEVLEKSTLRTLAVTGLIVVVLFAIASRTADHYKNRIAFWKNAALHSPGLPSAHVNLAYAYYARGEMDQARDEFEKAIALNPKAPTVHSNIAMIYYQQGQLELAKESFMAELVNNPSDQAAQYYLRLLK